MQLQWKIGDVQISRIVEIELPVAYHDKYPFMANATPEALRKIPWLYPHYVSEEGELRISIHALLVQAPGLNLLVDTCIGNDKPRKLIRNESLHGKFLEDLADAGCTREEINLVVCTHLHVDHVGWNTMKVGDTWQPSFPNARYLIGKEEFDYWSASDSEDQAPVMQDSIDPIFAAGLVDLVAMDHQISTDIRLLPTAGHTPGHVSVMIESKGQRALITGDIMHHPCQIAEPDWAVSFDEDSKAAVACRHQILEDVADSDILVIGTHFAAPTAGNIIRQGRSYKFITEE